MKGPLGREGNGKQREGNRRREKEAKREGRYSIEDLDGSVRQARGRQGHSVKREFVVFVVVHAQRETDHQRHIRHERGDTSTTKTLGLHSALGQPFSLSRSTL